ncbi:MAG: cupin domain-containing protein [Anaerolineales bacterium]|jgi:quercetin dioxygenase-like cupin family protein
MEETVVYLADIGELAPRVPSGSILSRTFHEDERLKAILFGFAPGQELSEHTASQPAILHFLQGEADLVLGKDEFVAAPGTWVRMPARLPHSVRARTPVTMLLLLYKE